MISHLLSKSFVVLSSLPKFVEFETDDIFLMSTLIVRRTDDLVSTKKYGEYSIKMFVSYHLLVMEPLWFLFY